ncbi:MAG TPA: DNA repair protein RecO [Candidatus Paceibacterota bacterium]
MSSRYSTLAVVLKTEARGEYDLWCVCFTERFGKMRLLAKGARKPASKLRAALQPLSFSHIEFVQGKIWRVVDVMLQNRHESLRSDAKNLRSALAIAALCCRFTEEQDEVLWKHLLEALDILNVSEERSLISFLVYYHFLWNLLSRCGYAPVPPPLVTSLLVEPLWKIRTLILGAQEQRELSRVSRTYLERAVALTS